MDYRWLRSASLCFPSMLFGFAGQRFMRKELIRELLGLIACMEPVAYRRMGGHSPRTNNSSTTAWLSDPVSGRGFTRTRAPASEPWQRSPRTESWFTVYLRRLTIFRACEETETVINLHVGSSSSTIMPCSVSPLDARQRTVSPERHDMPRTGYISFRSGTQPESLLVRERPRLG